MKIGKPVEEIPAAVRAGGPLKYQEILDALAKHPEGTTLPVELETPEDAAKMATAMGFAKGPYRAAGVKSQRRGNTVYVWRELSSN